MIHRLGLDIWESAARAIEPLVSQSPAILTRFRTAVMLILEEGPLETVMRSILTWTTSMTR